MSASIVVTTKAGTHTPCLWLSCVVAVVGNHYQLWLWVPAFAGTTTVSILQVDHPLGLIPRLPGNRGIDGDFLTQVNQAVQNLGQGDPLHVRTQIARPYHFDIRHLGLDIVGHRAFRDHHHALWTLAAHPVDHVRG